MTKRLLPPFVAGLFLLLFLAAAVSGPDFGHYMTWARAFRTLDTTAFLAEGDTLSPMGVPLSQWSHGPGLIFSLCPEICHKFMSLDRQAILIGWALTIIFWWAMVGLLRHAAYGDVQWIVYGVALATVGTQLGFYSRSYASETLSQAFLAVMALWVVTRKTWRILDALVMGCLAGFLVITRAQLLIYAVPLLAATCYFIWKSRDPHTTWLSRNGAGTLLSACLIPLLVGLTQVGFANRWMTGSFLGSPYSFGNNTFRSLDFARPELSAVLFHPWHGLLTHHPFFVLGFIVLLLLVFQSRTIWMKLFYIGLALAIATHVYLQAAWYVWWLGMQSFGMRGMSIAAVVLVPALIRFMREREIHKKSNTILGIFVLAACLWSAPLFLQNLYEETQFMTYADLLGFFGSLMHSLQPRYLLLGAALSALLAIILVALDRALGRPGTAPGRHTLRAALIAQMKRRLILSISLVLLVPIGLYCLIGYGLNRYSYLVPAAGGLAPSLAVASIPISATLTLLFLALSGPASTAPERRRDFAEEPVDREHPSPAVRTRAPRPATVVAVVLICLFVTSTAVFARLAVHIERSRNSAGTPSFPADRVRYVSSVHVKEVEESYFEYLSLPGFEAKKQALRAYGEELKACTAVESEAGILPRLTGLPRVALPTQVLFGPDLLVSKVTLAGGMGGDKAATFRAGDLLALTIQWRVLNAPGTPVTPARPASLGQAASGLPTKPPKFSLRLADSSGRQWLATDYLPQVGCEFLNSRQPVGTQLDHRGIPLPPDLPPGQYEVSLVVYDPETGTVKPADGAPGALLARINVVGAAIPPDPGALDIPVRFERSIGQDLELLGYGVEPSPLQPERGGTLRVWWRAPPPGKLTQPSQVQIELVGDDGQTIARSLRPLSSAPPDTWQAGQIVGERYPLVLDPGAVSGVYQLRLSLVASDGTAKAPFLLVGSVPVQARPRKYDLPPVGHSLNMRVGQNIALRGYTLDQPASAGNALRLTLYWQALGRITGQYKVFVHLVDGSGHIIAQQDNYPADGAAPTQSWLAGEVIADTHELALPAGGLEDVPQVHRLYAGMYDPLNGERLPVRDASGQAIPPPGNAVPLGPVEVEP